MNPDRGDGARGALVFVALLVVALASAGVVWAVLNASEGPSREGSKAIEPAQETTSPGQGAVATPAPPPTDPATPATSATSTGQPPASSKATELIAFRKDGRIHVGTATGSDDRVVARSAAGPYALSPDGRVLAHVTDGRLWLVPLDGGQSVNVGPASGEDPGEGACPVWSTDSRHVYFTRTVNGDAEVWRVTIGGGKAQRVMDGSCPSVSPDGRVVAAIDPAGGLIVAVGGSTPRRLPMAPAVPVAVAAGEAELYVAVIDATGESAVERMAFDGSRRARVLGPPVDAPRATWGVSRLSPDGARLAAAAVGDDRYSRLSIIDLASGRVIPVGARRDTYVRYWSADGRFLYYVEGNAYQGEPTRLMRVESAGVGRTVVVDGAE